MTKTEPIIILGAGLGGLSAAIHLAASGRRVVIFEKNETIGGKVSEIHQDGFRWDTGPSVITMTPVFEELFKTASRKLSDYLTLHPIEPLTRYFYPDGTVIDATLNHVKMLEQIQAIHPRDVEGFLRFLSYASRLYRIVSPVFIHAPPPSLKSFLKVSPWDALQVDGLRTMQNTIDRYVSSPQLRQLLGRFATYVGASPYQAPATLNVIAHVELNQGIWYPKGGIYRLVEAFTKLALELGVEINTHSEVTSIDILDEKVHGIHLADDTFHPADAIIANLDVSTVYRKLLVSHSIPRHRIAKMIKCDLSCSGFILLLGIKGYHPELLHHNILFSENYPHEFHQIFHQGVPPQDPTIYIAMTSRSTPEDAPAGHENWFVMVNVPPIQPNWNWEYRAEEYSSLVLAKLAERGFDIRERIISKRFITPLDLQRHTGARLGALYGISSNNRLSAFRRPHNRDPEIRGLYFAGGTAHPGGGVPMVTLSGKVASQLLIEDGF